MTIAPVPVDEAGPGRARTRSTATALLALYREMARIRAFEEEVVEAFGRASSPARRTRASARRRSRSARSRRSRPDDQVLATYRGHGEALVKGVDPVAMMAELMGRETGICKGKGGSMHLSDPSVGLVSTNAIVAGHIPMAGGVALSGQLRRRARSCSASSATAPRARASSSRR